MAQLYNWSSKSILIADDDLINFELLKLMLRQTGVEIHHVTNGQNAINTIEKDKSTDLVIMDIQMPVVDGIQATVKLREMQYNGIIFALTALNTFKDIAKYKSKGFDEIVEKPVRREVFLKLIDKYLG